MKRLVYLIAKDEALLAQAVNRVSRRTSILGSPVWTGSKWVVWMVTEDDRIKSGEI